MRRAAIDIGTNSVKLLVAEVRDQSVLPVWEGSEQTRLGQGFYEDRRLRTENIQHTVRAVSRFAAQARELEAASIRVLATSAPRDAVNGGELLQAIYETCGLQVEVISGEQEAEWASAGVRSDPKFAKQALLILDLGGGSTEFVLARAAEHRFRGSYPIGSVRLLEQIRPADPPSDNDWQRCRDQLRAVLEREVKPQLQPCLDALRPEPVFCVGTGGTTSILAAMEHKLTRFDRELIEQTVLSRERVRHYRDLLWSVPLAERKTFPGLPPNRADVILFGVAVYLLVMEVFEFDEVRVSTRGLRFAAVMDEALPKPK